VEECGGQASGDSLSAILLFHWCQYRTDVLIEVSSLIRKHFSQRSSQVLQNSTTVVSYQTKGGRENFLLSRTLQ